MTSNRNLGDTAQPGEPARGRTYLAVALVECMVVIALWAFGRYFGAP